MANALDEMNPVELSEGRDARVIAKQLPIKVGFGSTLFQIAMWAVPLLIFGAIAVAMGKKEMWYYLIAIAGIIPGIIWEVAKVKAKSYLNQLQQKINRAASSIDNYMEQRVVILKNAAKLLDKAIELDKDTFTKIAQYRSGSNVSDAVREGHLEEIENVNKKIQVAFENYPELKSHQELEDCMQQNSYLQKEITAARELYNDVVDQWNREVYEWPTKMIVAAKESYTTRIPFVASSEVREEARGTFF